jgi:REP element-mobilizing transposase RayT
MIEAVAHRPANTLDRADHVAAVFRVGRIFFIVNLLDRRSHLLVTHIDSLRSGVRRVGARAPFQIAMIRGDTIRDDRDFATHFDYGHFNSVSTVWSSTGRKAVKLGKGASRR